MYSGEQIETQDNDFDTRVPGVVHRQNQNREEMALLRTSRENVLRQEQNGNEEKGSQFFGGVELNWVKVYLLYAQKK